MDPKRRPEQQRRCGDEHERPFTVDRQQTAARLKREGGGSPQTQLPGQHAHVSACEEAFIHYPDDARRRLATLGDHKCVKLPVKTSHVCVRVKH